MPADSEAAPPSEPGGAGLPRVWRPLGARVAGVFLGGMLFVMCAAAWLTFAPEVRAAFNLGQRITLVLLGLMVAAALHALGRCRVEARSDRLVVVNGYRRRELEWAQVLGITLPPGAPWATLDLADGTSVPAMGIQGSDGDRARGAVRELRELLGRMH